MTLREASDVTGIAYSTLYGNLTRGNLNGRMIHDVWDGNLTRGNLNGRMIHDVWDVSPSEVYGFVLYAWQCQTIGMYPPSRVRANFAARGVEVLD